LSAVYMALTFLFANEGYDFLPSFIMAHLTRKKIKSGEYKLADLN